MDELNWEMLRLCKKAAFRWNNRLSMFVVVGGAFGGNRGARPVPPEKGVFPLDHMHLCDLVHV